MGLMRTVIAFLTFLPFVFYFAKKINWSRWKEYTLIGATGSAIPAFLYAIAQTEISSIASGLLNSLTPMFTVIFGLLFFNIKSNWYQLLGVSVGLIGAIIIILYGSEFDIGSNPNYAIFVVLGTMCYAMNANFIKHLFQKEDPMVLGAVSFLFIGVPFFFIAIYVGIPAKVISEPAARWSLLYVSVLAVMSTVVSLILYYQLIQRTTPLFASSVTYLIPVVVLFWGVLDGESLVVFHFVGLLLIIGGVYLVRRGSQ